MKRRSRVSTRTRSSGLRWRRSAAPHGWRVRIEKHIPVAAGLGGGSSDAATALRLANSQLDAPRSDDELQQFAARVGADVPFFLCRRPAARHRRRQSARALDLPQDFAVLLLLPNGGGQALDRGGLRGVRRTRRRARLRTASRSAAGDPRRHPPAARSRRAAAERSRLRRRSPRNCSRRARSAPTSAAPGRRSTGSSTARAEARRAPRARWAVSAAFG